MRILFLITTLTLSFVSVWAQTDQFAGKNTIDYNGLTWEIGYQGTPIYYLTPLESKYNYEHIQYKNGGAVKVVERPIPDFKNANDPDHAFSCWEACYIAFYDKLQELSNDKSSIWFGMWIDSETGKVADVSIGFYRKSYLSTLDFSYFDKVRTLILDNVEFDVKPDHKHFTFIEVVQTVSFTELLPEPQGPYLTQALNRMRQTVLPHPEGTSIGTPYTRKKESKRPPLDSMAFPNKYVVQELEFGLWQDFGLTTPLEHTNNNNCVILRKFDPINGNYQIALIGKTYYDQRIKHQKKVLMTIDNSGQIVDQLEVGYAGYDNILRDLAYVKEFSLSKDEKQNRMVIQTWHLKPKDVIMFGQQQIGDVQTPLQADLFHNSYSIDASGHFIHIEERLLELPGGNYTLNDYKVNSNNFGERGELEILPSGLIF